MQGKENKCLHACAKRMQGKEKERLIVILRVTMIVILWMTMVRKRKEGLQSVYLRLHDCLETMQRKEKERLIKRFFFRVS